MTENRGKGRRLAIGGSALSVLAVVAAGVLPGASQATFPGENGEIAFQRADTGDSEIFRVDPITKDEEPLTDNSKPDIDPAWSADGRRLAYASGLNPNEDIFSAKANGKDRERLTDGPASDRYPAWSPDRKKIAFTSDRKSPNGEPRIWVMNADGTDPRRLSAGGGAGDHEPQWSPDGKRIVFSAYREGVAQIYVMKADGSNETNLSNTSSYELTPSWSPDGTKIAYMCERGDREICVMDRDGDNPGQITNNSAGDAYPAWSPDGERIAFLRSDGSQFDIIIMDADGQNEDPFASTEAIEFDLDWRALP